jgi:hypothetical protein
LHFPDCYNVEPGQIYQKTKSAHLGAFCMGSNRTAPQEAGSAVKTLLRLDVGSLLALRAGRDLEAHALVFRQRLETGRVDCRKVRENVFTTAVRGNEAKTLRIVEPFNSTARHFVTPLKIICCCALYGLVGDETHDANAGLNKAN